MSQLFASGGQSIGASPSASVLPSEYSGLISFKINWFAVLAFQGILQARILEWVAISSSSGPCFVRTLHYDLSGLGGPARHGS